MDANTVIQIIQTLGFPIVVACALFWYVNKQDERHGEEMGELRHTIEENTEVLAGLKEIISLLSEKVKE